VLFITLPPNKEPAPVTAGRERGREEGAPSGGRDINKYVFSVLYFAVYVP
jgi:hypothetical protein